MLRFAVFESASQGSYCFVVLLAGVEKAIKFSLSGDAQASQLGEWDVALCQPGDRISLALETYPYPSGRPSWGGALRGVHKSHVARAQGRKRKAVTGR